MSWDGKKWVEDHADGTPLEDKKHFVLRLDSDDPVEAARVAAAMRAYKSEPRNCDMPLVVDGPADNNADKAWLVFKHRNPDAYFDVSGLLRCIDWLLAPATEGGDK